MKTYEVGTPTQICKVQAPSRESAALYYCTIKDVEHLFQAIIFSEDGQAITPVIPLVSYSRGRDMDAPTLERLIKEVRQCSFLEDCT